MTSNIEDQAKTEASASVRVAEVPSFLRRLFFLLFLFSAGTCNFRRLDYNWIKGPVRQASAQRTLRKFPKSI